MSNSTNILTLKVPFALASMAVAERKLVNKNETNPFVKNIATFLILKAETSYSLIKNYSKQIDHLSFITQCERQTFKKRLLWMKQEGLITIEGGDIRLKNWKEVAALYYFNLNEYKTVTYNPNEDKNIHLQLFATEIEENKNCQAYKIKQKLNKNPDLKREITLLLLQRGADEKRLNNFNYFLAEMLKLYRHSFVKEPAIHAMLKDVRPDTNRGVKGIANAWNCKSKQTVSYWKKKLVQAGIVRIDKGEKVKSHKRSRNSECHVMWLKNEKQTMLCLVDNIEIIEKKAAA